MVRCAAALVCLVALAGPADRAGASERNAPPVQVVVLKRAGVTAYEEVAEEFGERCRVRARVVSFGDEGVTAEKAGIGRGDLVVTVGQEALDAIAGAGAVVIPTLAFHIPAGLIGPPVAPPPELLLRVLQAARGNIRRVATVYGPRSQAAIDAAGRAATRLGITLIATRVDGGPAAVRALHAMIEGRRPDSVHAIWLPGDTDVVTPQVFQYALRLQLELGIPVAAATRQQVHSGALVAVDFNPRAAGRAAANIANRLLDGKPVSAQIEDQLELTSGARITVNAQVARRLDLDVAALARMGARIE